MDKYKDDGGIKEKFTNRMAIAAMKAKVWAENKGLIAGDRFIEKDLDKIKENKEIKISQKNPKR